jgi:hypothetical protein
MGFGTVRLVTRLGETIVAGCIVFDCVQKSADGVQYLKRSEWVSDWRWLEESFDQALPPAVSLCEMRRT